MNPKQTFLFLGLGIAALLCGCTMAPDYQRPDTQATLAPAWPQGEAKPPRALPANQPDPTPDLIGWRDFYTDPRLQKLIERSLTNNPDLRLAALNVEKARAQYQITEAPLLPTIDAAGSGQLQRTAKTLSGTGYPVTSHAYTLSLGFTSYELDLFGRLRSLKAQALDQYLSLKETRTATQITLVSEIAGAWFTWLADRDTLALDQDIVKSQRTSTEALRKSRAQGIATELDLRDAQTALDGYAADAAEAARQVALDRNALEQLLGEPLTPEVEAYLTKDAALDGGNGGDGGKNAALLRDLPPGLPSDLLERRPDLRAAEDTLRAANANIGAARAAFFPSITLTAALGTASNGLSGLFADGSNIWQFAPKISLPLFDGGVNQANLDVAKASRDIAVTEYQKAIQSAFRETADALASRSSYQDQLRAVEQEVADAAEAYRLAKLRSDAGVDTLLNTLTRQRTLFTARRAAITLRLAKLENLVTLYRVLGGGWQEGGEGSAKL